MKSENTRVAAVRLAVGVSVIAALLQGCSTVSTGMRVVNNVRAGSVAYDAYSMGKEFKDGEPLFSGYDAAVSVAELHPRDGGVNTQAAFEDNMVYIVQQTAGIVGGAVSACADLAHCSGAHVLIVQFREQVPANVVQRLASGDKIRGVLDFTDAQSGRLVAERKVADATTYVDASTQVERIVAVAMLRSFPGKDSAGTKSRMDALNSFDPIKPADRAILGGS